MAFSIGFVSAPIVIHYISRAKGECKWDNPVFGIVKIELQNKDEIGTSGKVSIAQQIDAQEPHNNRDLG